MQTIKLGIKHRIRLKCFSMDNGYDVFIDYPSGIHEITRIQYEEFNKGKNIQCTFTRDYGKIYMLKKGDVYMFFYYGKWNKNMQSESLYHLYGGKLCSLVLNHKGIDKCCAEQYESYISSGIQMESVLKYYYYHMDKYATNVKLFLESYTDNQKRISRIIKQLGGSGKIHGAIIDVDMPRSINDFSYCHLFVNPMDGKVTPYQAFDVTWRTVYKDFKALLMDNRKWCKAIEDNYMKCEEQMELQLPISAYNGVEEWDDDNSVDDDSKEIYIISRIIRSLQYILDKNVIRSWNEKLLEYNFMKRIHDANSVQDLADDSLIIDECQE